MSEVHSVKYNNQSAQELAGAAILLEIGAQLGVIEPLVTSGVASVSEVASKTGVREAFIADYYRALAHAGLVETF